MRNTLECSSNNNKNFSNIFNFKRIYGCSCFFDDFILNFIFMCSIYNSTSLIIVNIDGYNAVLFADIFHLNNQIFQ